MGAGLFERFPKVVSEADELLGYSIRSLCLDNPDGKLGRTEHTQPALYVVSYLHALSLIEDGSRPTLSAGHSVGEFAALASAGSIDFADGLRMVAKRGEIMSKIKSGGMAAVIGLDADAIRENAALEYGLDTYLIDDKAHRVAAQRPLLKCQLAH